MTMRVDTGREEDFERAYRECAPLARSAAYRVLHEWSNAEDVVQEVFAHLWRRPDAYDPSRGSLRNYVALMARSRALDRQRTTRARDEATERAAEHAAALGTVAHEDAAVPVERRALTEILLRGLDEVPRPQREAILLAYGGDLTSTEIADALGVPLGTAKSRVRLGLEKVRAAVAAAA